ncbi:MAG: relaxase/mobilization nuclease domain-containing protein [Defluviitaleaceae bacterium]|nr:relaxase/mobilization nuclease domain-containing protein [Defluviitaleaceae bacterium]
MAATWIKPLHVQQGKTISQCLGDCTEYAMNSEKTNSGELVTSYKCDPATVDMEFLLAKSEYAYRTGRDQGAHDIIAYHVRQAFAPGEIDAKTANELGHKLAHELMGGNHAFIVATHVDRQHLHNHVIINSVNLDCTKKFRNPIRSYKILREISDRICAEHNLSVIAKPDHAKTVSNRYREPSKRDKLTQMIDDVILQSRPKDFDEFLKQLKSAGCKIKCGANISIQALGQRRFIRLSSLPEEYHEKILEERIAEAHAHYIEEAANASRQTANENNVPNVSSCDAPMRKSPPQEKPLPILQTPAQANEISSPPAKPPQQKNGLLLDLENVINAKKSKGFKYWAQGFNLQKTAETILFLQNNNLTDMATLKSEIAQANSGYNELERRISNADTRIKEIGILQRHVNTYKKTRDIYYEYLRSKRNPDFYAKNKTAINDCREAKEYFDSLLYEKLPTTKELQIEYANFVVEKQKCILARSEMKQRISNLQSAKENCEMILGVENETPTPTKKYEHTM